MRAHSCRATRVMVLCLAGFLGGVGTGSAADFRHVRSSESAVRDLLSDGYARSATFRALITEIESRSCIVYVETVVSLSQGMEGALLHTVSGAPEMPILRVALKASLSGDRAVAILAHELQHVVEATSRKLDGARSMTSLFNALEGHTASGASKFETEEARAVTDRVFDELRHSR
jgi:hypothetical protein